MDNQKNGEIVLSAEKSVRQAGNIVYRPCHPWTPHIHSFLRHLEKNGFSAPTVLGMAEDGREMLSYVPGDFVHPRKWSDGALCEVARMVRRLHDIGGEYAPKPDAIWQPWFLHGIGGGRRVVSHGDIAPWNMVTTADGMPKTLIDWEFTGFVDPLMEFARVAWLFVQLHDDDLAQMHDLPPFEERAKQVRLMADAYGLSARERFLLTDAIIEVVVLETAQEGIDGNITMDSVGPQWGLAWRARSAGKIVRNREILKAALY